MVAKNALPVLALVLSVAACVIAIVGTRPRQPAEDQHSAAPSVDIEERLQALETRLTALDESQRSLAAAVSAQRAEKLSAPVGKPSSEEEPEPVGPADEAAGVPFAAAPALAELERRHSDLQQKLGRLGVFEHFEAVQEEIEEAYAVALNGDLSAKERLAALGTLRRADRVDEAVVASVVELWDQSLADESDGAHAVRWYILENIEGSTDEALRNRILERLHDEPLAKLRGRAVQTLGPMLPDPAVEEWFL